MARMGPAPKPTAIKKLQGNMGNRPLNDSEPMPEIGIPEPPAILQGPALDEWNYIAPKLYKMGILSLIDKTALSAYCAAYGRWYRAEEKSIGQSMIVKSTKGTPIRNPLLREARDAANEMHKYICDFGMTPAARTRIRVDAQGVMQSDGENKKLQYLKRA